MLKKEEIINKLKEQYQDEYTIHILAEYVEEFQNILEKYVPTDEVIKRLKRNIIKDFEFTEQLINGKMDGQYDDENKKVIIYKGEIHDLKYLKFVLFHELTHAVTTKELTNGKRIMGFSFLEKSNGRGLNEATTEWITMKRNDMLNEKHNSGYDVIVEQLKILSKIIGEDTIIHCYFYEPENLKNLLAEYNIDFDRLDRLYQILLNFRVDIHNLANSKRLNQITGYNLYKECNELIDIYMNAIGDVTTIENFKRKYEILCSYQDATFNINNIISYRFYSGIYNEVIELMRKGYKLEEIEKVIRYLGISISKINQSKKYSEIFTKDKNEAIVRLYEIGCKDEVDFKDFVYNNYSMLYDKFSEDNFIPNQNCLYDVDRYLIVGKFLSQHPEYEFDEISVQQLKLSNNVSTYTLKTYNGNTYIYTIPFMRAEKISEDGFEISSDTDDIVITINEENVLVNSNNNNIYLESGYYKESQLESFEYKMNDAQLPEVEREAYRKKYNIIKEKIDKREQGKFAKIM